MPRETLPATFPSRQAASDWSGHLKHQVLDIIPAKERPGRWQVVINRQVTKREE